MFKTFELKVKLVAEPFENLKYRDRTVLIMCRDGNGKYLLGSKERFFPKDIVRLLGGGVDKGEAVIDAAIREIKEETGIDVTPKEMVELTEVKIEGSYLGNIYYHSVFVYFLNSTKDVYIAGDDVEEIVKYSEKDFRALIKRYSELKDDNIFSLNGTTFSWGDYGKVYGFIHEKALDEIKASICSMQRR
jgi:8-oxo-dGTP pyrophosphatase MutT (NUDIX family)